jgi:hypothetical protein
MSLVAEGFDQHIPKGYIYFAIGFSVLVEALNLRVRSTEAKPVSLRQPFIHEGIEGLEPAVQATGAAVGPAQMRNTAGRQTQNRKRKRRF